TLNIILVRVMGYRGLALGTAIASIFNASTLFVLLSRRLGGLDERRVTIAFAKIFLASIVMGVAAHYTGRWLTGVLPGHALALQAVRVFTAIGVGVLVLLATARLLAIEELNDAIANVAKRLGRS